jgi:putative spermidine/putrescine transport system permease protein
MNPEVRLGLGLSRRGFAILGGLLAIFLIVPLLIIIPTSWTSGAFVEFPPKGFSFQWYEKALDDPTWTSALWVSLKVSVIGSVIATILGTALALGMRRLVGKRGARIAQSLIVMPLAIPYVSYALGLYQLFTKLPAGLSETIVPLALGEAVISIPLVYVIVAGALATTDPRLSRAASTMGARWPTILWKVELPLVRTAIIAGFVFAFATVFDEATLAIFLSPVTDTTIAQELYRSAAESIAPTLSAVSTMITMAAIVVLGIGSLIMRGRNPKPAASGGKA